MTRPPIHPGEILADEIQEIGLTLSGLKPRRFYILRQNLL